ncbi:MAG: TrmH family RNA methyltransferase [bacterium]|nr:TrmH family RNA methyltransferase [bacterium]
MNSNIQSNFAIVLVSPQDSLNIGAVARAMMNLGFNELRLVAPRSFILEKANAAACAAIDIVTSAQHYPDLASALLDIEDAVAFSARTGRNRPVPTPVTNWAAQVQASPLRKTALVFGPEEDGLCNEDLARCREIIAIPASKENTSFNLAQAVLIALYEISRGEFKTKERPSEGPPLWADQIRLGEIVDECAWRVNFYRCETPKTIPNVLKGLFLKIQPDKRDLRILLGFFKALLRLLPEQDKSEKV